MFLKRKLLIATQHGKEKVIAPIIEQELGVICFVTPSFDTDNFGTFTGEIERKEDAIKTAKNKCLAAMEIANCDMGLASEGSFGSHPFIYYVPSDEEFLLFIDKKNDLEIIVRELSTETNFNAAEINSERELKAFANGAQFPSHGLIIRKSKDDFSEVKKGITNWETLLTAYHHFSKIDDSCYVETDMRALYNPTRMKVIEKAAIKLIEKIKSLCPKCASPGFAIKEVKTGLPCELCSFPTRSTISYIYTCLKCNNTKEDVYPHGKTKEDPLYCDVCNP